jgi:glycosyltransferase involved in cell wall biosynthesis
VNELISEPKISVVVPVYNVDKYLPDCIRSLVSQTYRNLEIILCDDGSTDENNWAYAATRCANSILEVNPNALIFIEGVEQSLSGAMPGDYWGMPDRRDNSPYIGAWWGGNFRGAREYPIVPDSGTSQIVYSPHDYGPSVYAQTWFDKDFTTQTLLDDYWYDTWAYINAEDIAPELIGEWGGHMDGAENQKWMTLLRDYMIDNHINHTFWCLNTNSGDTGGLWANLSYSINTGTTITWEEKKYALMEPSLWQTSETGKYIGLDHQIPLGQNGLSLNEFYSSYSSTEGSNIDGGTKSTGNIDDPKPEKVVFGDVTNDKKVTVADLVRVSKYIVNAKGASLDKSAADVNADGKVNVFDMILYKEYLNGSITKFPGDKS